MKDFMQSILYDKAEQMDLMKEMIQKKHMKRTIQDVETLMNIIQGIKFFKEMKGLTRSGFRDLAAAFQVQQYPAHTNIFEYGSSGQYFYVILNGQVSVHIPNPLIKYWKQKRIKYDFLLNWKKNCFDQKIEAAIEKKLEGNNEKNL